MFIYLVYLLLYASHYQKHVLYAGQTPDPLRWRHADKIEDGGLMWVDVVGRNDRSRCPRHGEDGKCEMSKAIGIGWNWNV